MTRRVNIDARSAFQNPAYGDAGGAAKIDDIKPTFLETQTPPPESLAPSTCTLNDFEDMLTTAWRPIRPIGSYFSALLQPLLR